MIKKSKKNNVVKGNKVTRRKRVKHYKIDVILLVMISMIFLSSSIVLAIEVATTPDIPVYKNVFTEGTTEFYKREIDKLLETGDYRSVVDIDYYLEKPYESISYLQTDPEFSKVSDKFYLSEPYRVIYNKINIYSEPNTASKVVDVLHKGSLIRYTEKYNGFISTKLGWIKLDGLENAKGALHFKEDLYRAPEIKLNYTVMTKPSGLTPEQINYLIRNTGYAGKGQAFYNMEHEYNINVLLSISIARLESAGGTSVMARTQNNIFGLTPDGRNGLTFNSIEQCMTSFAKNIKRIYHNNGMTTINTMAKTYSADGNWKYKVTEIFNKYVAEAKYAIENI